MLLIGVYLYIYIYFKFLNVLEYKLLTANGVLN